MNVHSLLAGFASLLFFASAAAAAPRNVVLFVVDDAGKTFGCYGDKLARTPNLDRFATEGTRFNYAYCTTASCSASRSVILSGLHNHLNGQYGHQHGYNNFHTLPSVRSLPVLMGEGGYRTARIGKFHVQPEEVYKFQQVIALGQGGMRNPVSMAEKCREFIGAKDEKPFFLYFCTADPHRGGGPVKDNPQRPDAFGNNGRYDGVIEVVYDPKTIVVPPFLPDTPECRAELAQYYQSVARVDQGFGRLVQILKDAGRYEDTLIIFTTDNGIAFPGAKTTVYDPGLRLPLIIRAPDQRNRGGVCNAMISWVDFTPTILDWCGVKVPDAPPITGVAESGTGGKKAAAKRKYEFHGRSFAGVWNEENPKGWDEVYASHTFHEITMYYPMRVVQTRQFKLILNLAHQLPYPFASDLYESATWQGVLQRGDTMYGARRTDDYLHRPRYELYELNGDPNEVKNLADDPKHAAIFGELSAKLKAFQERTGDPWVVKYHYE